MVLITLCCYVDKLIYSVDNFVKVLYLLCFETWITLLCVRVVRTVLEICAFWVYNVYERIMNKIWTVCK